MKQLLCTLAEVPTDSAKTVELCGAELVCPWHGARFDSVTGACLHGPARADSQAMFLPTRIEAGALVYVWGE